MRRAMLLLTAVAFFSFLPLSAQTAANSPVAATNAQQPAAETKPAVPKFVSRSQLVLVPVIVTSKSGEHVTGLKREAFKIEEHGKERHATIFEEVTTVAPAGKFLRPGIDTDGHSNFNFTDPQNWRMTVVVMDMLNTPFLSQTRGKDQLMQYLSKSLQREEPTALFGLNRNGLKQLHPFTTNTAVLIAALKKVRGQVSPGEINDQSADMVGDLADSIEQGSYDQGSSKQSLVDQTAQQVGEFMRDQEATMNAFQQREAIRTTLTAMTQIAKAYSAVPGRKTMIWATGGFPFMIDDPQAFARMGTDMVEKYEETWRALISADIAVYTVDLTGLDALAGSNAGLDASRRTGGFRPGRNMNSNRIPYDKSAEKQATLRAFADATGGTSCVNDNDLEKCFAHAVDDSKSYYMLGYYLPSDDLQPGWRKLKVKVDAGGTHVRARQGFYVAGVVEDTPANRNREIVDALRSPVEFTGVRLSVREMAPDAGVKAVAAGKTPHLFVVDVLGSSVTVDGQNGNAVDLSVISVAVTAGGKNGGQAERHITVKLQPEILAKIRQTALSFKQSIDLAQGKYDLRVAVRDNLNGEIGSVAYPLEVK